MAAAAPEVPGQLVDQPAAVSITKLSVSSDRLSNFQAAASARIHGARDNNLEPGCLRFDVLEGTEAPNTFLIVQAFATSAALEHHKTTTHYKVWEDFAKDGLLSQEETAMDLETIPSGWAFQANDALSSSVPFGVLVTVDIKADRIDDFLKVMLMDVQGSRNRSLDPGCLRFDLLHDSQKPFRYHFFEAYATDDSAAFHKTTAHYKAWADFKASGGVEGQEVFKWRSCQAPLPGFQSAAVRLGGSDMPLLGFGCYKVGVVPASASATPGAPPPPQGPEVANRILGDALGAGYRMLDSAAFYMNEAWTGGAIQASGIARENIYISSKVWNDAIYDGAEAVKASVEKSIEELQCRYLDLCLVHWPVPGKHVEAYKALKECKAAGKVKEIGVSNYTIEDYEELRAAGCIELEDKPVCNQIEVNPLLYRKKTIDFFQKEGVHIQAYRGLMQGNKAWEHAVLQEVCQATGRSPAQVLGRFLVQQGISHIPKSSSVERMRDNAAIFGFSLSKDQMAKLSGMTTPEALKAFEALYTKSIWRDTPQAGAALPGPRTLD